MSLEAINWAFAQDVKKSSTKLVLLALADFSNDKFISYPSIKTLQEKCSCSRQTVVDALKDLVECKLITKVTIDYMPLAYYRGQNCYQLLVQKLDYGSQDFRLEAVQDLDQSNSLTSPEIRPGVVQNLALGSLEIRPEVVQNLDPNHHITINKPSYNHKDIKKEKSRFVKPTIDEIKYYISEKDFQGFDVEYFYDYYESNGWIISKSKMKCWKSTVNNWHRRQNQFNQKNYQHRTTNSSQTKVNATIDPNWSMTDEELDAHNAAVMARLGMGSEAQQGGQA